MGKACDSTYPILIVDDEEISLLLITAALEKSGWTNVITCSDSRGVLDILSRQPVATVFLDLQMPHFEGEDLLPLILRDFPEIPVVVCTMVEDVETSVRCMKLGAFDYVVKPVQQGRLAAVVKNAVAFWELQRENIALRNCVFSSVLKTPEAFSKIITQNGKMHSLFRYAESIAPTSESVLITGETGVGKDLLARAIHESSGRKGGFVAVNVAGLDDNVFSDTLFGHVRGAFTGAEKSRGGLIEQAYDGTLFLDEIGDLTAPSQAKMLRLLQEGDYFPLGQDVPKHSNARVLSATNRDLWSMADRGVFRRDLNYRLRTHHINIPPLRERIDDLPLLIDRFIEDAATELNKRKPLVTGKLLRTLETYGFPGNVRELRAMVFNAMSLNKSKTLSSELFKRHISEVQRTPSSDTAGASDGAPSIMFPSRLPTLKQANELLIREALRRAKGNQSLAGRMLGISQQAVSKRLKTPGLKKSS
jgi:DNA-binding NtrC family response regulator